MVSAGLTNSISLLGNSLDRLILINYAASLLGLPYIWGGQSPLVGFDCSGLVIHLKMSEGEFPQRQDATSQGLYLYFKDKGYINTGHPTFGCLAFYGKSVNEITHVAYCLDDETIIEAAGGGSKTLTRKDAERDHAFVRLNPIKYRKDLVAVLSKKENVLPFRAAKKKNK